MPRSILPFKISSTDPQTPLSVYPYNSRTVLHSFDPNTPETNYKYVAFRPGYAVQASELNDIQENFYKENTLFANMINFWGPYVGSPYAGSGDETTNIRYGGPGWEGATPLAPYGPGKQPDFDVLPAAGQPPLDEIPNLVDVTDNGTSITIQFNQGYYLTSVRTGTSVDNGFKYFVYLNYGDGNIGEALYTTTIAKASSGISYVGMFMTQSYVFPEGSGETLTDRTLQDNSASFYNVNGQGASRVSFNFNGIGVSGVNGGTDLSSISPVLYIDHGAGKVRYLSNLLIANI